MTGATWRAEEGDHPAAAARLALRADPGPGRALSPVLLRADLAGGDPRPATGGGA